MTARVAHIHLRRALSRRPCSRALDADFRRSEGADLDGSGALARGTVQIMATIVLVAFGLAVAFLAFNGEGRDPVNEASAAITTGAAMQRIENETQEGGQGDGQGDQQEQGDRQQQDSQQGGQQKD